MVHNKEWYSFIQLSVDDVDTKIVNLAITSKWVRLCPKTCFQKETVAAGTCSL